MKDTIFNENMEPVFAREPTEVLRRLRHGVPDEWTKVLIGETQTFVTIAEYLHGDVHKKSVRMVTELIGKKDLALYTRNPKQYEKQIERTVRKIIELVKDEM
jgi:hypothetical protein